MGEAIHVGVIVDVDAKGATAGLRKAQEETDKLRDGIDSLGRTKLVDMAKGAILAFGVGGVIGLLRKAHQRSEELRQIAVQWSPQVAGAEAGLDVMKMEAEQRLAVQSTPIALEGIERDKKYMEDIAVGGVDYAELTVQAVGNLWDGFVDFQKRRIGAAAARFSGDYEAARALSPSMVDRAFDGDRIFREWGETTTQQGDRDEMFQSQRDGVQERIEQNTRGTI